MPSECHSESNVAVSTASRLRHLLRQVSLQLLDFPVTTALALVTSVQLHSQKSDGVQSTLRECGVLPCPPGPAKKKKTFTLARTHAHVRPSLSRDNQMAVAPIQPSHAGCEYSLSNNKPQCLAPLLRRLPDP